MHDITPPATDPRVGEILAILARETGLDPALLRPEATIEQLGIASIDMAQTLFALETHFDVEIPVIAERAGAEFSTIADLTGHVIATIERARAQAGGTA